MGVAVAGNYAYVADGYNGLVILDVSNPAAPTFIGSYRYRRDSTWEWRWRKTMYMWLMVSMVLRFFALIYPRPLLSGSVHNINKGTYYTTIQAAINDANQGDELHVDSGTFHENVNVNKQLTLRGIGMPVVDAGGNGSAITLAADGIIIEGFTAMGGGDSGIKIISNNNRLIGNTVNSNIGYCGDYDYENGYCNYYFNGFGIHLYSSSNNKLIDNNVSNNQYGVSLDFSNNNTLSGNNVSSNSLLGIYLGRSSNNTLSGNNALNNDFGIELWHSSKSVLMDNIMNGNTYNFDVGGDSDSFFDNQIDTTNLVEGKPVYYIKHAKDLVFDSYTNAGTFYCISCVNVTLKDLDLKTNSYLGIFFWNTTHSKIQNVTASKNQDGIMLSSSSNNMLSGNNASNNGLGLYLSSSSNNMLIGNDASNNFDGIYLDSSSNNNTLSGNNANSNNYPGIYLGSSSNNTLIGNDASNNLHGIYLDSSSNNKIYHNNIINNTNQAQDNTNTNSWDNGYPSGGNYWSNYTGVDLKSGPVQNIPGSDGIGDTPYSISGGSGAQDRYPFITKSGWVEIKSTLSKIVISGSPTTTLTAGGKQLFTAIALDENDNPLEGINLSWTVSNSSVGNVESPNVITNVTGGATSTFTALVAGTTLVNATNGSITGTAVATVSNAPSFLNSINVTPAPKNLVVGENQTFIASPKDQYGYPISATVTWSSSNETVGTVNSSTGNFTALVAGTTLVNATNGSVIGTSVVTVKTALTSSITVVSPDGGENWGRGTTQMINWTSTGSNKSYVKIELMKPGVANKVIIASTLNDGSHPWLIPVTQVPGTDYKIKITNTTNAAYNDTSDNTFTIPDPTITVVSPNGTESWIRGTIQTIKWNSSGSPGAYVKIELLKPGMANKVIIASTLNDGIYAGLIPATLEPGNDYKVKITSTANASYNDTSDNSFTIPVPSITVVSPNGGENWTRGTTQTIRWNSTENPKSYVKIELIKPGVANKVIVASTLNDGIYAGLIPANQVPGTDYKVKITSTVNVSNSDTSDNTFTIPAPSFTVFSPNGDENWTRGTTQTIRWNSTENPKSYVKIEILKSGVPKVIIASTLNDGSHPWLIPSGQTPGNDYKIRVTSTINVSNSDTSDNNFTIPVPSFTIVSPNGLENWTRGTTQTIRWNSTENPKSYVKIELIKPGVANKVIIASTLNDGSHPWLIPATQTPGADYKIRITSTANVSNNDTSDNNFSIIPPKITVTSPDGNENWIIGTVHAITWNYTGNPGTYVKIELLKGGVLNRTILASTPNDRSQSWTIPAAQAPGEDYKIRITSTTNLAYNDTSDNNFNISSTIP